MTCERKHVADSTKASQTPEHLRKFRTFHELINHNQPSEVSSNARAALAMEITSLGFTAWSIFSSTKDIIMAASHSPHGSTPKKQQIQYETKVSIGF